MVPLMVLELNLRMKPAVAPSLVFGPGFETPNNKSWLTSRPQARSAESEVLVPISSTKTTDVSDRSARSERKTLQAALSATRLAPERPPHFVFDAEAHPLKQPTDGGVTQSLARHVLQEAASLDHGSCRALLDILFEELLRGLVRLRRPPRGSRRARPAGGFPGTHGRTVGMILA
jgi:hypothetical protein